MCRSLHGCLPTKCEPGNVVVDFEIAVPTILLKQSNAEFVFIVYQPQIIQYSIYNTSHRIYALFINFAILSINKK